VNTHPGVYSMTGLMLNLKRLRGPFFVQTFMPSTIFIFTSWISFLMQPGLNVIKKFTSVIYGLS